MSSASSTAAADEGVVETLVADAVAAARADRRARRRGCERSPCPAPMPSRRSSPPRRRCAPPTSAGAPTEAEAARWRARADALEAQLRAARAAAARWSSKRIDRGRRSARRPSGDRAGGGGGGRRRRSVRRCGPWSSSAATRRAVPSSELEEGDAHALLLVTDPSGSTAVTDGARCLPARARSSSRSQTRRSRAATRCSPRCSRTPCWSTGWRAALDLVLAHPGLVAVTPAGDRFGGSGPWRIGGEQRCRASRAPRSTRPSSAPSAAEVARRRRGALGRDGPGCASPRRARPRSGAPPLEERRDVLAQRLAEVEVRLAARDPEAQAAAERHRRELLERDAAYSRLAERIGEHRAAVGELHDRLRDRRRRQAEAARASAEQLDKLRVRAGRPRARPARGRGSGCSGPRSTSSEARLRLEARDRGAPHRVRRGACRRARRAGPAGARGHDARRAGAGARTRPAADGADQPARARGAHALQERHEFLADQLEDVKYEPPRAAAGSSTPSTARSSWCSSRRSTT